MGTEKNQRQKTRAKTQTVVRDNVDSLSEVEEQVLRARHGYKAPDNLELGLKTESPELLAKLAELEKNLIKKYRAAQEGPSTKQKIIQRLKTPKK